LKFDPSKSAPAGVSPMRWPAYAIRESIRGAGMELYVVHTSSGAMIVEADRMRIKDGALVFSAV
jgi:hypothetical protein